MRGGVGGGCNVSTPPVLSNFGGRLSHPWLFPCTEMLRGQSIAEGWGAAAFPKAPPGWVGFAPPPGAYSEAETLPAPLRLAPARAGPSTSSRSFLMSLFANSFPPRHRQSPQHRQGQPPVPKTSPGWSPPAPRCPRGGCRRSRGCWCRRTAGGPAPKPAGGSEVRPSPLVLATLGRFYLGVGGL